MAGVFQDHRNYVHVGPSPAKLEGRIAAGTAIKAVTATPEQMLALHARHPERYPALLESAAQADCAATALAGNRFDILFAFPGERLTLNGRGELSEPGDGNFLRALDRWWLREQLAAPLHQHLPFTGGWLMFLGYELAQQIEPRLQRGARSTGPMAQAIRVPAAIVHQRGSGDAWIVAESGAAALVEEIAADLHNAMPLAEPLSEALCMEVREDPPELYLHAVERALEYIAAGDIYQANLSRGWTAQLHAGVEPVHLYQRLRRTNPGPFAGLAVIDGQSLVSSSPERLIEVRNGWAATRPIAGTRPRGTDRNTDMDLVRELRAHPKERAEHVMLIDLERNDLGRVCEAGTVQVDEFMTIESYAHVHHIVSNVRGRLRPEATPGEILAAVFPGGTITGCPKVRCMQIIAELEAGPRGAYTGSLGYLNRDGSMDFNILIRSLEMRGSEVKLRAGAGIVADSEPSRELAEARAKARGVLRALGPA